MEIAGAARRTLHEDGDTRFADTWSPTVLTGAVLVVAAAEEPGYGHAAALLSAPVDGPAVATSEEQELNPVIETNEARASNVTLAPDGADTMPLTASEVAGRVGSGDADAVERESFETAARMYASDGGSGDRAGADGADDSCNVPEIATLPAERIPALAESAAQAAASSASGRLAPGSLGAMVAAHLMAHPEMDFTPTELSHALGGKSSGAIYNSLVKMVNAATAIQTCERPRRFRHAPCADGA